MRTLLLALLSLPAWAQYVPMAFTPVAAPAITLGVHASAQGAGTTSTTTPARDTTGMSACYVAVGGFGRNMSTGATISDSASNTWAAVGDSLSASNADVALFYPTTTTAFATSGAHTFTVTTASNSDAPIAVLCFSGTTGTAGGTTFNSKKNNAYQSATSTVSPGNVTADAGYTLILSAGTNAGFNITGATVVSMTESQNFLSGKSISLGFGYLVQAPGTTNPVWSAAGSNVMGATQAAFK